MLATPKIKLTYFDIAGRAEAIRLALTLGDIAFEDIRVSFEEWQKLKPTVPGGQLPALQLGEGPYIGESLAMLRYAGKLASLYPEDADKALYVDSYLDVCNQITYKLGDSVHEKDPEKKSLMRKVVSCRMAVYLYNCSRQLVHRPWHRPFCQPSLNA